MKGLSLRRSAICALALLLLILPSVVMGQAEGGKSNPPPVSQPLVNEGILAVNLVAALGVSSTDDEIEAESVLGDLGISPRNGWIADYPVTPDIIDEVSKSVADAAYGGRLSMTADDALARYNETLATLGLMVRGYGGESGMGKPLSCENYPNPATISTTYTAEGPPVVTYYCPPPDYYYLYTWVPYPFWWYDFWYPGFFVLRDFHRVVPVNGRVVVFTNHFRDVKHHRAFRIDPVDRFHGRTFAGIGAPHRRDFISTGVPRSSHTIFNRPRAEGTPAVPRGPSMGTTPQRGTAPTRVPSGRGTMAPMPGGESQGGGRGGFQGTPGGGIQRR